MIDVRRQMVTCRQCKKVYQCTPENDYYNSTTLEDGLCEFCLLDNAGLADRPLFSVYLVNCTTCGKSVACKSPDSVVTCDRHQLDTSGVEQVLD